MNIYKKDTVFEMPSGDLREQKEGDKKQEGLRMEGQNKEYIKKEL